MNTKISEIEDKEIVNSTLKQLVDKCNISDSTVRRECHKRGIRFKKEQKGVIITPELLNEIDNLDDLEASEFLGISRHQMYRWSVTKKITKMRVTESERRIIKQRRMDAKDRPEVTR